MTRKPTREVQRLRLLVEEQQREIDRLRAAQGRLMRQAVSARVLVEAVKEATADAEAWLKEQG